MVVSKEMIRSLAGYIIENFSGNFQGSAPENVVSVNTLNDNKEDDIWSNPQSLDTALKQTKKKQN